MILVEYETTVELLMFKTLFMLAYLNPEPKGSITAYNSQILFNAS